MGILMKRLSIALALVIFVGFAAASAEEFDPYLHQKALDYDQTILTWHTTGLGGLTDVHYTDDARTEMLRTGAAYDSTDWTAFYLVSQALRYRITGDQVAYDEVLRMSRYLHLVHTVTQDPGYIARYVGYDEPPWNIEQLDSPARVLGTGEFEGMFWLGRQSRDKYMHWYWGQSWAYDIIQDEEQRQIIRDDLERVAQTLIANDWTIIDPWGETWPASDIGPDIRLEILLATAHVTGDNAWWDLFDAEFDAVIPTLPIMTTHLFNRYMDYYAFINDVPVSNHLFRLWPDQPRMKRFYDSWMRSTRKYQADTHSTLFNAIFYGACLRLDVCDPDEIAELRADVLNGLNVFNDPPNYQRSVTPPVLPLDPFSVWASDLIENIPWLQELINIDPQTAEPHVPENRCWRKHIWEVSPYHIDCHLTDDPSHTGPGLDYTLSYWFGVYFGLLPGDGPYDDFAFYTPPNWTDDDDDDDDDDNDDDNGDDDDDDDNDDDDDDDDDDDNDAAAGGDDDDDDGGCGC
jgi:hypothetical protein